MSGANDYVSQIGAAVDALRIEGSNSYCWRGARHRILPPGFRSSLTDEDIRAWLVSVIETRLYGQFYCLGGVQDEGDEFQPPSSHAATLQHVQRLSAANRGRGHFDPGWCVLSASDDRLIIMKDGLRLEAARSDCHSDEPIIQGISVSLRTAKECFGMTPGFYLVVGSAPGAVRGSSNTLVRMYWNVTPTGAIRLIDEITGLFNSHDIPFRCKALRDPSAYQRCDAAVLYASKEDLLSVWGAVSAIHARVSAHLKSGVPAMTRRLAPGLGLAEDPQRATSFGLHRCGLIAEALVCAHESRKTSAKLRLASVAECFAEAGVELAVPYLSPGAVDDYPALTVETTRQRRATRPLAQSGSPLEAAVAIGRRLADSAIHSGDACTWVGYQAAPYSQERAKPGIFGTMGPCLYDGASGIAWFLCELFALTKDDAIGSCAAAALHGALRGSSALPSSLFAGWMGVALASAYGSQHLSCPRLRAASTELLNRVPDAASAPAGSDLLTGHAGVITGLLLLAKLLRQDVLVDEAAAFGERLIESAEVRSNTPGCSWPSGGRQVHPNLAGLSHGASGAALALLKLYEATGRPEFRECAHQGVLYERSLFNQKYQDWPDLRTSRAGREQASDEYRFPYFWCHGAPGVGVARLAGAHCLGTTDYLDEARVAFRSTYEWTARKFSRGHGTGCLCHGVVGNALVLMHAEAASTQEDAALYRGLASAVAAQIAGKVLQGGSVFGDSTEDVDNPSLMLGLAGIGHFLLRFGDIQPASRFVSPLWLG